MRFRFSDGKKAPVDGTFSVVGKEKKNFKLREFDTRKPQ
jgi:hypothetical protein